MPGGRPSPIDAVVGHRQDGTNITVADQIVNARLAGAYIEHAAANAGITKETVYEWLRVAGRLRIRAKGRPLAELDLTDHERRCLEFSDAVAEAEAQWLVNQQANLEALGRGGIPVVTVIEERGPDLADGSPGPLLKRKTTTKHTLPDATVIMWRLERAFPEQFGRRIEVTTPPSELSDAERAAELITGISSYLEDVDAAATVRATPRKRARKAVASE